MNLLKDDRINCYSIMSNITIDNYLNLIQHAYEKRGGIEGQRDVLKTRTALRIRSTMIEDLKLGAILPPIVLGIIIPDSLVNKIENVDERAFQTLIDAIPKENISIIDGMQRTTAVYEAVNSNQNMKSREIRIEYWIAHDTNSLLYRMMILNTGQVPWTMRRQIEVVFGQMIREIKQKVPSIEILEINAPGRRSHAGQFQANQIIELFLVFGARKANIDIQERLADEFTKLDFIEVTADRTFTEKFYQLLYYLTQIDRILEKYTLIKDSTDLQEEGDNERFEDGRDLFSSHPARIGFIAAIAEKVLARPGMQYIYEEKERRWKEVTQNVGNLITRLSRMTPMELGEFLDFNTLNQVINIKARKVGEFERDFFKKAFGVLIEEGDKLNNMTPCWRAL